jgi:hypothetical protein
MIMKTAMIDRRVLWGRRAVTALAVTLLVVLGTAGCLEQYQSTRLPGGAVFNFYLHLRNGELEDARTYFAPGLVPMTAELDQGLVEASNRVKPYEVRRVKFETQDLPGGEKQVTLNGEIRPRTPPGTPTPGPEDRWEPGEIITARVVERGPGWRILDYQVLCCPEQ